ncbi:MAG: dihydrofolate reductase family protein [Candidatus Koribacter versatilis]|uniref:Dihydrofolate reductase family protein n=1 Tax=Candidatus Korobacter versatilis TaxID=658062 RepID=A0A932EPK4_9BACT|nr:dihydrofolate reductase family protein [Candidatus Koribacter versatilis]
MAFETLFDHGEPAPIEDAAYGAYGRLGFPPAPAERPWLFTNFVQSLDGIVSFGDKGATTADLSQSQDDRWLMDLLRAHADAVLLGVNTLVEEAGQHPSGRGFIYRIQDEALAGLRRRLGRGRETNIFVTGAASLDLGKYRVFDGEHVDAVILTTEAGAKRLAEKHTHPHVRVLVAGEGKFVDLPRALAMLRRELNVEHLLCEGGPTLAGHLQRAKLVDEMFLTTSPVMVGQRMPQGEGVRPATFTGAPGFRKEDAPWWRWMSCRRSGEHMFNRYRRREL